MLHDGKPDVLHVSGTALKITLGSRQQKQKCDWDEFVFP